MKHFPVLGGWCLVLAGTLVGPQVAWAQEEPVARGSVLDKLDRVPPPWKQRRLAPGVGHLIDPAPRFEELVSFHDMIHVLNLHPRFGQRPWSENLAKGVQYLHDVYHLEFWFKPVRMIWVDVPQPEGRFVRKQIWYMVYRVRNTGPRPVQFSSPKQGELVKQRRQTGQRPIRFIPRFVLHAEDLKRYYPDRLVPVAMKPIMERERPPRVLLDSVQMASVELPPPEPGRDNSVWGVACWEDVDPSTDFFSVYVQGLTNAYRREAVTDAQGHKHWKFTRKTLRLYFWRPGDAVDPHDREIRFGRPGHVAYEWVYR